MEAESGFNWRRLLFTCDGLHLDDAFLKALLTFSRRVGPLLRKYHEHDGLPAEAEGGRRE
jgi:hypothetical protein